MTAARFKPGDWVVYVPKHAYGDKHHPDCERGTVTHISLADTIFVRYGAELHAKATSAVDLISAEDLFTAGARSPNAPRAEFREYLGDGAFVGFDGFNVVLTAEDGARATDVVYLEPRCYASLVSWYGRRIAPLLRQSGGG